MAKKQKKNRYTPPTGAAPSHSPSVQSSTIQGDAGSLQPIESPQLPASVVPPTIIAPDPQLLTRERDEAWATIALLRGELAAQDAKSTELQRLREECAGLRAHLLDLERLRTDHTALQAEVQQLTQKLHDEETKREGLRRQADYIDSRSRELDALRSWVDETTSTWGPERVTQLELQLASRDQTIAAQQNYIQEREHKIQTLAEVLNKIDKVSVAELQAQIAALTENNRQLGDELTRYRLQAEEIARNSERLRRDGELQKNHSQLLQENISLRHQIDTLRSQTVQADGYQAAYEKMRLEYEKMAQALNSANESEKQRQERGLRAFDTLASRVMRPEYQKSHADKIRMWPGDSEVIDYIKRVAQEWGFHFDEFQIRSFLASMRSSRVMILKGFSGLGKSSLPKIFSKAIGAPCEIIPVQPGWKSKVDLMGFFNHFEQQFLPTQFTVALLKARMPAFQNRLFFILLDEMNLARVEYYFSDFNAKLEDPQPVIELFESANAVTTGFPAGSIGQYLRDGNKIQIPDNIWFVGTANDDETTYAISDKIYDRAQVIDFVGGEHPGNGRLPPEDKAYEPLAFASFKTSGERQVVTEREADQLDRFLRELSGNLRERFYLNLSYRPRIQIQKFVNAYCLGGGDRSEALDLQLISKVLPKIRYSHLADFAENLRNFGDYLEKNWIYPGQTPDKTLEALELLRAKG